MRAALEREQTALAAMSAQPKDLKQQMVESRAEATLRIEVLQREFVDLERRGRTSEAAASIRMANLNLVVQGQRFQLQYLTRQTIAMDSLWWRLLDRSDGLAGGSTSVGALSGAVHEMQAMDLSDPRDLSRFSSTRSGNLESSSIDLAHRSSKPSPVSAATRCPDVVRDSWNRPIRVLGRKPDPDAIAHCRDARAAAAKRSKCCRTFDIPKRECVGGRS